MSTSIPEAFEQLADDIAAAFPFQERDTVAVQVARQLGHIIRKRGRAIDQADAWDSYGEDL